MFRQVIAVVLLLGTLGSQSLVFAAGPSGEATIAATFSVAIVASKHWNGPEAANLKRLAKGHPFVVISEVPNLEGVIGVSPDQIERAAVVAVPDGLIMVLRTDKPFDQRKVVGKVIPNPTATRMEQGNRWTLDKNQQVVCLADQRTLLIIPTTAVGRIKQMPLVPWSNEKLSAAGDSATGTTLLCLEVSPVVVRGLLKADDSRSEPFRPLAEARSLKMKMDVEQGLKVTFSAGFSDQLAAERGVSALRMVMQGLNAYFDMAKAKMPEFLKTQRAEYPKAGEVADDLIQAIQAAQAGLHEVKLSRSGNEVEATIVVKADRPVSTAMLLLSLMPRAPKKP